MDSYASTFFHIGDVYRHLFVHKTALGVLLAWLDALFGDFAARDDHLGALGHHLDHFSDLALVISGDHLNLVAFF